MNTLYGRLRESAIELYLVTRVAALGGMAIKLKPPPVGIPDRLVIFPGCQPGCANIWFIEVKSPTGTVAPAQAHFGRRLVKLNARYQVVSSKSQIDELFPKDGSK